MLDLGCGAGMDCIRVAGQVGPRGRVTGIDMTPEMLARARALAIQAGCTNLNFLRGGIEDLPIAGGTLDAVISNCVVNLSPDKERVLGEAFRVLRPGGRICISDLVATRPLPHRFLGDKDLVCGCMGGAASIGQLGGWLEGIGFAQIQIEAAEQSRALIRDWAPGSGIEDYVVSALIMAGKPG